jgi:hypothetical protein
VVDSNGEDGNAATERRKQNVRGLADPHSASRTTNLNKMLTGGGQFDGDPYAWQRVENEEKCKFTAHRRSRR